MNIANRIENQAKVRPNQDAVNFPKKIGNYKYQYEKLTFSELDKLSSHYAYALEQRGIKEGDKVLLFVRPSLDFPALTFALFKMGAIPILIDPGMGKKNLLKAIESAKPDALMAVPEVHIIRLFYRKAFKSIKTFITTGPKLWPGLHSVKSLKSGPWQEYKTKDKKPEDMAAILFTSGGTGRPKGVVYTHKIFNKQTDVLQEIFTLTDKDVDLPGFPLFSFFTMSMGMTSCIPDMNPSKPSQCDPQALVANIKDNQATFVAGSPAIWERVAKYCLKQNIQLDSVKYVVMFGAPVRNELHEDFEKILPNGTTYTPYGATESLPVANISGRELLSNETRFAASSRAGHGTCIGQATPGLEIKVIKAHDNIIEDISQAEILETNAVGELIVKGDVVTPRYLYLPEKTAEAKIKDGQGFWHRMGDLGRIDENGNIWFYGRKVHRIETTEEVKYSIPCEAIYNNHPKVKRTALVNYKSTPAIIIETKKDNTAINKEEIITELKKLGSEHSHTKNINDFFFSESFPVDIRHNIKIDRKKLGEMATKGTLQ
jgi:acyl-CoA synthetase (AMP-forming)/AMP-acid ligase II